MKPRRRFTLWIAIYAVLDVIAVGVGMGVPIFAILLGFAVGWFLPVWLLSTQLAAPTASLRQLLSRILRWAGASAAWTFLQMAVIWLRTAPMLFDPSIDIAQFGEPMILYEPVPSFIGWIVLMVFISPFLQLLTTAFAAMLRLTLSAPAESALGAETVLGGSGDAA
jgi:hypothetical protein